MEAKIKDIRIQNALALREQKEAIEAAMQEVCFCPLPCTRVTSP